MSVLVFRLLISSQSLRCGLVADRLTIIWLANSSLYDQNTCLAPFTEPCNVISGTNMTYIGVDAPLPI